MQNGGFEKVRMGSFLIINMEKAVRIFLSDADRSKQACPHSYCPTWAVGSGRFDSNPHLGGV